MLGPAGPAAALPLGPLNLQEALAEMPRVAPQTPPAAGATPPGRSPPLRPVALAAATAPAPGEPSRARAARPDEIERQLQRLEEQIAAGNRVIAEMFERVAAMEREVAGMRARVQSLPGVAAAAPAAPAAAAPLPRVAMTAEYEAAERRKRQQALIDNGLLLLAAGVLLLLAGVAYWTWGRPALKDRLREARLARTARPAAA